jgi:membrane-associated phospholipid phosphatase
VTLRKPWLVGLVALAGAVYLIMWFGWTMKWGWVVSSDSSVLAVFHRFGVDRPAWLTFWNVLCTVLGPTGFRVIALAVIVYALIRRQLRIALFLVVSVELSGLVTEILKAAANRPRPLTAMAHAPSSSFPSGHALCVMAGVLALTVVLLPNIRRASWGWVIATGAVIVVAIGIGRVALNVHNPSDVVAGWAAGYVWFAASLLILARRPVTPADERPPVLDSAP